MLQILKNTAMITLFLQQTQASINKMNDVFLKWSKEAGLNLTRPANSHSSVPMFNGPRGFQGQMQQRSSMILTMVDLLQLLEYGCWCYFDGDYVRGRGEPVDEFDNLCKQLHQNYVCASMDAELEDDSECIPWETEYQVFSFYSYSMDIEDECKRKNPITICEQRACIIEMTFVLRLMQQYHLGTYPDDQFQPWAGFDTATCFPMPDYTYDMVSEVVDDLENEAGKTLEGFDRNLVQDGEKKETQIDDKQCCGAYPDRFPFKPKFGMKQCCGWRTYDTRLLSCCDDLSLQVSCF